MGDQYGSRGTPLQSTRHAWIIERVNSGVELSIGELSTEWGISTKTLQRDFEKLSEMLPGFIERAPDGKRFRRSTSYSASNDDEMVIDMFEGMAQDIGGQFYTKAHALLKQLRDSIATPYYMRIGVEDISSKFELIRFLENAIEKRNTISFEYRRWYDESSERRHYDDVRPLRLIIFEGYWYLLTQHGKDFKKFYLKEITECTMHQATFTLIRPIQDAIENSLGIWFEPDAEPFEVTLFVNSDIVIYFERKPIFKNQRLYKKPDGTAELVIKITSKEELTPILRYWLPNLRVLEPIGLQEEFERMLESYLHP